MNLKERICGIDEVKVKDIKEEDIDVNME